jgi:hypothetical protein
MKRALRHPALQLAGGLLALLLLTWPLLVFERPVQVFVSFFIVWALIIGALFAISRAQAGGDADTASEGRHDV